MTMHILQQNLQCPFLRGSPMLHALYDACIHMCTHTHTHVDIMMVHFVGQMGWAPWGAQEFSQTRFWVCL